MARYLAILLVVMACGTALARPPQQTLEETNNRLTVTLTTLKAFVPNDPTNYCTVRVRYVNGDKDRHKLSEGDVLEVWLEGQWVDVGWYEEVKVTAAEAAAGSFDRTFSCISEFSDEPEDVGYDLPISAWAHLKLDNCKWYLFCNQPDCHTDDAPVRGVADDKAEPDDTSATARPMTVGLNVDHVSLDQDWFTFDVAAPSKVDLAVDMDTFTLGQTVYAAGYVDMALFDSTDVELARAVDTNTGVALTIDPLAAGTYNVRVTPRQTNDPTFYDARLILTAPTCKPEAVEQQDCARCGKQSRTCDAEGAWGAWTECSDQGECEKAETKALPCGNCGTQAMTCSDTCEWVVGECTGEGECVADAEEVEDCGADGTRTRTCDEDCRWGDWGTCVEGAQCPEGMTKACYEGSSATRNVGECKAGVSTCTGGVWGGCEGDVMPVSEACANDKDDDCDGETDDADTDCQTVPTQDVVEPDVATPPVGEDVAVTMDTYTPTTPDATTSVKSSGGGCAMGGRASGSVCVVLLAIAAVVVWRRKDAARKSAMS